MIDAMRVIPAAIEDHPASDKLLYRAVADLEPTTKRALVEATAMSPTTVYRSLERLEAAGVIERTRNGDDLRYAEVATAGGA